MYHNNSVKIFVLEKGVLYNIYQREIEVKECWIGTVNKL